MADQPQIHRPSQATVTARLRRFVALLVAFSVSALGAGGTAARDLSTSADATPAPPVLDIPITSADTCARFECLPSNSFVFLSGSGFGHALATVIVAPPAGLTATGVVLQYECVDTDAGDPFPEDQCSQQPPAPTWQNLVRFTPNSSHTVWTANVSSTFGGYYPPLDGLYNLQAQVTYSDGSTADSQTLPNVDAVDDNASNSDASGYSGTYVGMEDPGQILHGTVSLVAAPENAANALADPDQVSFQICAVGQSDSTASSSMPVEPCAPTSVDSGDSQYWTTIDAEPQATEANGNPITAPDQSPEYSTTLDTTTVADGTYDLRVTAEDANGDYFVGNVVSGIVIDNTPPTLTLDDPGPSLIGVTTLSASASSGAGIASVMFQYAPAGSGAWSTIGVSTIAPYAVDFDTRDLQSGSYDLRAVATDIGGLSTDSAVVSGVAISNSAGRINPDDFTITDEDVPATGVTLLGGGCWKQRSRDLGFWIYGGAAAGRGWYIVAIHRCVRRGAACSAEVHGRERVADRRRPAQRRRDCLHRAGWRPSCRRDGAAG